MLASRAPDGRSPTLAGAPAAIRRCRSIARRFMFRAADKGELAITARGDAQVGDEGLSRALALLVGRAQSADG
jgi:hypothetical protein